MLARLLIDIREWYIHVFKKKILMVEKDKNFINNKAIITPLNLFYFFIIKDLLKYKDINLVYELDGLIFYDNNRIHKVIINQIMLEFNMIDPKIPNEITELTEKISKYSIYVPFYIIVKLENININYNIQVKLMNMGKIINKEYQINTILHKYLHELLM